MIKPVSLTVAEIRHRWIRAQKLNAVEPFGRGPEAVRAAIEHLGYVQIDTINVIERCHHHILFNRIPAYRRSDLAHCQSTDKSVFEYWTHALAYVPTRDYRFFAGRMGKYRTSPGEWYASVKKTDLAKVFRLIEASGPLSIRDINDDELVEKDHPWASRKPSKRALQLAVDCGTLVVSGRRGMLKQYELAERHFGWNKKPTSATEAECLTYRLDRALRSQGAVSLDSICHLEPSLKPAVRALIEGRVKKGELVPLAISGFEKNPHWMRVAELDEPDPMINEEQVHLLSPFDPLTIQRKRLELFFDYVHRFEAYLPKEKRVYGYFALPVLQGDRIVAALDIKADRTEKKLLVQQWTWIGKNKSPANKKLIERALDQFAQFQFARENQESGLRPKNVP